MRSTFRRVTKAEPCPVCGRPDWCLLSRDGRAAICPRTPEGAQRDLGAAGYLHNLVVGRASGPPSSDADRARMAGGTPAPREARMAGGAPAPREADFALDHARAVWRMDMQRLEGWARLLGVSRVALRRLEAGWDDHALVFPMRDARGRVSGLRLRSPTGRKWSATGSREGLFIPRALGALGPLVVCEGPTDTAAMLDLGLDAIGRPSCLGGVEPIVKRYGHREVVVLADNDGPGRRGAEALAERLEAARCPSVRIVTPARGKDAREWKRLGATREEVLGGRPSAVQRSSAPPKSKLMQ